MSCFSPNQVSWSLQPDGKKKINFSKFNNDRFKLGLSIPQTIDSSTGEVTNFRLPCSNCMACRIDRSQQAAIRMVHEAQMYSENSFVTLTYSPKYVPANGSLSKKEFQLFMKRLRINDDRDRKERGLPKRDIRFYACGEYGDKLGRPHFHAALFNIDFPDKKLWKVNNGYKYYTSSVLSKAWPYGFVTVGELTFESAAYISRYVTKKITGDMSSSHYARYDSNGELYFLTPEFQLSSNRPGIGKSWFDKYGMTDVYPHDNVVAQDRRIIRPPKYYDKLLERIDPELFLTLKRRRSEVASSKEDELTYKRLQAIQKCREASFRRLVRKMESEALA